MPGDVNEKNWDRAKDIVKKQYPDKSEDDDSFWALTQHIYQNIEKGSSMNRQEQTRVAFINGVLYSLSILQKGLEGVQCKLVKLCNRAEQMITHLDALSADAHSSQLTTVCKKLQKAMEGVQIAKDAIDEMLEDVTDGIVLEEESNGEQEEGQEQQQETESPEQPETDIEEGEQEEVDSDSSESSTSDDSETTGDNNDETDSNDSESDDIPFEEDDFGDESDNNSDNEDDEDEEEDDDDDELLID